MFFVPYVIDSNENKISVDIVPMSRTDAETTDKSPQWQTSWTSDFIEQSEFEKYAVKCENELLALAAYEILKNQLVVHIVYMESSPESNPVFVGKDKKYYGIGKLLIAYGIKLSIDNDLGGDVVLSAKTTNLESHYEKNFGALKLPGIVGTAARYLICGESAQKIFSDFPEEVDDNE